MSISNFERSVISSKYTLSTIKKISKALEIPSYYITNADKLPETTLQEKLEKVRIMNCHTVNETCKKIGIDNHTYHNFLRTKSMSEPVISKINKYIKIYQQSNI